MEIPQHLRAHWISQTQLVLDNYHALLGRDLIARSGDPDDDAQRLWTAPFVALSHGTEADPILNFANRTTLKLWEMPLEKLVAMPSRLTAEPMAQSKRQTFLEQTAKQRFITGYDGVRISSTGRRFLIQNATIWNLTNSNGQLAGQAATFEKWLFLT